MTIITGLKIISVNINETSLEVIEQLIELKRYPSRSALFRNFIDDWLEWQMLKYSTLEEFKADVGEMLEDNRKGKQKPSYEVVSSEIVDVNGVKTRVREWERKDTSIEE